MQCNAYILAQQLPSIDVLVTMATKIKQKALHEFLLTKSKEQTRLGCFDVTAIMVVVGVVFFVITISHPTFCCVGLGLWLRWGWAVTIGHDYIDI